MTFPNAFSGVRKIFLAELLMIAAEVFTIISAILMIIGSRNASVLGGAVIVFGVVFLVAAICSFILNLIGISAAMRDEPSFKSALIFTLVGLGASFVSGFFAQGSFGKSFFELVQSIANIIVTLMIIQGIMNLADRLGNAGMAERGKRIMMLILAVQVGAMVARLVSEIFRSNGGLIVAGAILIIAGIAAIVGYFLYLGYLKRAKEMLEFS